MVLIRRAENTLRGSDAGLAALAMSEPQSPSEAAERSLISSPKPDAASVDDARGETAASPDSTGAADDVGLAAEGSAAPAGSPAPSGGSGAAAGGGDDPASSARASGGELRSAASKQVVDLARVTAGLREPPPAYAAYARWHPLAYAAMAGSIGGQTVMFAKSMGEIVKATAAGSNQFAFFFTYVILACMVACTVGEQHFLASGLQLFDAMLVVPVFSSAFMVITVLGGAAYFDELSSFDTLSWVLFPIGIVLTVSGVVVLSSRKQDGGGTQLPSGDGEDSEAAELCGADATGTAGDEEADGRTAYADGATAHGPADDGEAGVELASMSLAEQGRRRRAASDGSAATSAGDEAAAAAARAGAFGHGASASTGGSAIAGAIAGAGAGAAGGESSFILDAHRDESVASAAMQASPLLTGEGSVTRVGAAAGADGAHHAPSDALSLAGSAASSVASGRDGPAGVGASSAAGWSTAHRHKDATALPHGISAPRASPGRRQSLLRPGWEGVVAARGGGGVGGGSFLAFGRGSRTSEHDGDAAEDSSTRRLRAATETPAQAAAGTGAAASAAGSSHATPGSAGQASGRPRGRTSVLEATLGLFQAVTLSHTMVSAFNDEEAAMAAAESGSFPAGSVADSARGVPRPLMQRAVSARAGVQEVRDPSLDPAAAVNASGAAPLAGAESALPRSRTANVMPTRAEAAAASAADRHLRAGEPSGPQTARAAASTVPADGEPSPVPAVGDTAPSYAAVAAASAPADAAPGPAAASLPPPPPARRAASRLPARARSGSDAASGSGADAPSEEEPADAAGASAD